jgi:hypothetical protein
VRNNVVRRVPLEMRWRAEMAGGIASAEHDQVPAAFLSDFDDPLSGIPVQQNYA